MELQAHWMLISFLLQLPKMGCFDLYLSDTLHAGVVLANVSLGPGWIYNIDRTLTPKYLINFLEIDAQEGVLKLSRRLDCARLVRNPAPLYFKISSTRSENFILMHFNAFVHGQDCFIKYKRKSSKGKPDIYINYLSKLEATSCLSTGNFLMNVKEHLPVFRRHLEFSNSTCTETNFKIVVKNGSLILKENRCLHSGERSEVDLLCTLTNLLNDQISVRVKLQFMTTDSEGWLNDYSRGKIDPWNTRKKRSVNTHSPQFKSNSYQVSIPENEPAGTPVITLNAIDPDDGEAGRLQYSMEALFFSTSIDYFRIDPKTGSITTTQPLDRESKDTHVFKLTASDNGTPPRVGTSYLTVTVSDNNDHSPIFELSEYKVILRENMEVGFEVTTIRATDGDAASNANMIYKIVNGDGVNSAFEIDPTTGLVKIRVRPDRETIAEYNLIVEANDQGKDPAPRSATATLHITIEDENDNYPQFSEKRYVVQIPENVKENTRILQVEATDKDQGNNALVHYSIISGNIRGQFYIHSLTGIIDVINPLDYENIREYHLRIKAQDGGRPPLINSTGLVIVQVVDINDNAPMFVSTPFQSTVLENVPIGYSVIHIQAIDADAGENSRLEYRLIDTPPNFPFTINNSTGWITVSIELDRETVDFYNFGIEARDHGTPVMSTSASVSITVRDVNDNTPTFTEKVYSLRINEDAVVGSSVLTVIAIDRDVNSVVTYQISSGNTRNRFAITSQSGGGLITLALPLDYKQERQYVLTITASDGTRSDTAQVFINVTDANTHRPVFQNFNNPVSIYEDKPVGTTVVVISAVDEDTGENARITYVMEDNIPQFKIDPDSGAITTQMELDYEDLASYTLAIIARDNGIPQKSDTTYVEIIVLDANDNAPQFLRDMYQGNVLEDSPVYTSVLQISASDRDSWVNGRVSYTFQGGDDGEGDFIIEQSSGIIRTARKLDRENVPVYNLKAYAVDKGVPPLKAPVEIQITVLDINDNPPVFEKDEFDIYVEENSSVGSIVARIKATDPDEGTNAQIMYQIVEGNIPEVFQLDIFNGDLTALTDLDYESKTEYIIVVQASSAPLVSRATVHIRLVDINDNDPVLQDFEIIFNNYITNKSNSFPSGVIGNVPAYDPDVSDKLQYTFLEGNELNLLILNQDTGELKLSGLLDNNRPLEASMKVSVTDGIHQVTALCTLRVTIITDDMLTNSITVRLENMSQEKFLSPLLSLFVEGVAAVLSTTKDGIFIFNIQNDTDVHTNILNVTFSALLPGGLRNQYFPSEDLQEQIYLNRTLLTMISTQRVLPFDDNICLREPCENYMKCVSVLKFDSLAPFITSDTILFRPIHPINGLRCRCPAGFTGDYCETEVNLCYWNPCRNGGLCRSREGGFTCECPEEFTGDQCELSSRSGRCAPGVCKNGGTCVNLLVGGFKCDCPPGDYEKPYCEMTTRGFPALSFITFKGLRQRFHFSISLSFATKERNGLLLYNGRFNEKHDFIALEIINEQIQLTFSAGESTTRVSPYIPGGVSDGQWHVVQLQYYNKPIIGQSGVPQGPSGQKVAVVTVDDCDTSVALRFGHVIGNYTCSAQGSQSGSKKSLDLTGPLLLGGVPNLPEDFPVQNREFVGCMKNLFIDSRQIDMADFIANNGTVPGCSAKRHFCTSNTCMNGGTCANKWSSFSCECPLGFGGKNCEQVMASPQRFQGNSMVSWKNLASTISLPWYSGMMFRTRQANGIIFRAVAGQHSTISLQLSEGNVLLAVYRGSNQVSLLRLPQVKVNDGDWHQLQVELRGAHEGTEPQYRASIAFDYGLHQVSADIGNELHGLKLKSLSVGGVSGDNGTVLQGFRGCMQGVRVGETSASAVALNLNQAERVNVERGCSVPDPCDSSPCPANSYCNDDWDSFSCSCDPGYYGEDCKDVCALNPCEHQSICTRKPSSSHGYTCDCTSSFFGQYCENKNDQPCPKGWWGHPMCGPCNCDTSKGFDPDCNKTTGECRCKENHYQPAEGDTCFPCDCYPTGSLSRTCDTETGQCRCKPGVIGQQCDRCDNPFAEVSMNGCEVIYDSCPRAMEAVIWWPRTKFGLPAAIPCPRGSIGTAIRHCDEHKGWLPPNIFNCTSVTFADLKTFSDKLARNESVLEAGKSRQMALLLRNASQHTGAYFGSDVKVAYRLTNTILEYENKQQGFGLAATQDVHFTENLLKVGSAILDPDNKPHWEMIQQTEGGTALLLRHYEDYANVLAQNMRKTYLNPFTIITPNIVISVDRLDKMNFAGARLPRYEGLRGAQPADLETSVTLPDSVFQPAETRVSRISDSLAEDNNGTVNRKRRHPDASEQQAIASVIIYRSLASLLPEHYDPDKRSLRIPKRPVINSPVVSITVHDNDEPLQHVLDKPITVQFRLFESEERSKPICVFWNHSIPIGGTGGWSAKGCEVVFRNQTHISCQCNHMTSFAVLMDISRRENGEILPLKMITYGTVAVTLSSLFLTFVVLLFLRSLHSNQSSISKNMAVALFLSELIFLLGINQADNPFVCTVIAILLQFFYMCTFAWMFLEGLHMYRMMTEVRDINYGPMRFYYMIGWGVPAFITGLAVGLDPEGYGNPDFCWLSIYDTLVWSFAGPIALAVSLNVFMYILSARASCSPRHHAFEKKGGTVTGLRTAVAILLLVLVTWLLTLLAVNNDTIIFHYLFAGFNCVQGPFIFFFRIVFNKEVRKAFKYACSRKHADDVIATKSMASSYNCNNTYVDGHLYGPPFGDSTISLNSTMRSGKSQHSYIPFVLREDSGLNNSQAHIALTDHNSLLFHEVKDHPDDPDSDSDSDLSLEDDQSGSYASTHSSDSEEDEPFSQEQCWESLAAQSNDKTQHSVRKADNVISAHMKPYWPGDFVTMASDSEGHGGSEKLKVETLPNSEPPWDKLSLLEERPKENGDGQGTYKDKTLACLTNPYAQPHRGILKKKSLPTIPEKNSINRIHNELSNHRPGPASSRASSSSEGSRAQRPKQSLQEQLNGVTPIAMSTKAGVLDEDSSGSE